MQNHREVKPTKWSNILWRAPAGRATTHQGGCVVGKRLQPRLLSDALTREWQKGEAGEEQGSEPPEPGGLCQQAGGVS